MGGKLIQNRGVSLGLLEEVMFEQRLEEDWVLTKESSMCEGPEALRHLMQWRNRGVDTMAAAQRVRVGER